MRRTGTSKPCVWRWQERYVEEGVDGLLRDKTRPSRIPPLDEAVKRAVLTKTATETPAGEGPGTVDPRATISYRADPPLRLPSTTARCGQPSA
jgi:hypothetical protein